MQGRGRHVHDNRGNRVNRVNQGNGPISTLPESISIWALQRRRARATIQEWPELVHINRSLNADNLGACIMKTYARILFITAALILAACQSLPSDDASEDYKLALQMCAQASNIGRIQINDVWYVDCRTGDMRRMKDLLKMQVI